MTDWRMNSRAEFFAATLNYKLSGKISYLFDCETQREEDIRMLLAPTAEEVYMDLGAYNGDTIQELGRLTDWQWREVLGGRAGSP